MPGVNRHMTHPDHVSAAATASTLGDLCENTRRVARPSSPLLEFYRSLRSRIRPLRGGVRDIPGALMIPVVRSRWSRRTPGRAHGLPAPLVISLTSYPPRFRTLSLTLKCLLTQSIAPDRVVLWVAHEDVSVLPADVRGLREQGLEIRTTADLRSYKKIIPALADAPDAFVAIADDDVHYPRRWLETLVAGWRPEQKIIPCWRAHRMVLDGDSMPASYAKWSLDAPSGPADIRNVATGVGGVLYPPGCLPAEALDRQLFAALCPSSDDLWLYVMARCAGWQFMKVGPRQRFFSWPGTQKNALQHDNLCGGNDRQLRALLDRYGPVHLARPMPSPQETLSERRTPADVVASRQWKPKSSAADTVECRKSSAGTTPA